MAGPATPSALRPLRFWKRLIARRVFGPITPSALMPSAFWIWRVVTFFGLAWVSPAVVPPVAFSSSAANAVRGDGEHGGQRQRQRRDAAYVG